MTPTTDPVFLEATRYLDFQDEGIQAFVRRHLVGAEHPRDQAVALYYAVRDEIIYDPYSFSLDAATLTASHVLRAGKSFCVGKAVLLAAVARAAGIPTRLGFADVRNHLTSPRLMELMQTDIFRFHGFVEFWLDNRWLKATPAFNRGLCEKAGIRALEFDGTQDSVFHPFDSTGKRHMEYLRYYEPRADLPVTELFETFVRHYPRLNAFISDGSGGNFEDEAIAGAAEELGR